ncbi:MAG: polyprenyl synthetase family protein [Rhodobacter sp.]|nr:polyprenyl synthetase family protein [Rhodobacter sp.]
MSFPERRAARAAEIQTCLNAALADGGDLPLAQAMRHAVSGGKRVRGFLVMESALLHGVGSKCSVWGGAAIESMHAYSLVHDDLPCMDDDDLRRGQPTVHVRWNEATAVLAGDALQTLAFELLARDAIGAPHIRVALMASLATAAGARGMVMGQAQDIAAETAGEPLTLDQITELQANKTGALIEWSCLAGAVLGGADPAQMRHYARCLGLAFQIADDILDIEGDSALAGKRLQKDAHAGKATFVSVLGLDAAKSRARDLVTEACDALSVYGADADCLRDCARFVISRDS